MIQNIEIRDLSNNLTKSVKCPVQTNEIFYGGTASLILSSATSVVLFDIQQQKVLAELNSPPVKYVVWSQDGNMVALLSKHSTFVYLHLRKVFRDLAWGECLVGVGAWRCGYCERVIGCDLSSLALDGDRRVKACNTAGQPGG